MTDDSYYVGHRTPLGAHVHVHTMSGHDLGPLPRYATRRDRRFDWGRHAGRTVTLARSLLIDALGDDARCPACRHLPDEAPCEECSGTGISGRIDQLAWPFQAEVLATITANHWILTGDDIAAWIDHHDRTP